MKPLAIGFAARPGSGKTTLSEDLAGHLGWPRVSFGDYVRSVAQERGLPASRDALQDLGALLIAGGWGSFVQAVLRQASRAEHQGLVIDGLRHHMAVSTLRTAVEPLRLCVVYLDVPDRTHAERLKDRGIANPDELVRIESHSTEVEVREIREIADVTVVCEGPIREVRDILLAQLERFADAVGV